MIKIKFTFLIGLILFTSLNILSQTKTINKIENIQVIDTSETSLFVLDIVSLDTLIDYTLTIVNTIDTSTIKINTNKKVYLKLNFPGKYYACVHKIGYDSSFIYWDVQTNLQYQEINFYLKKKNITKKQKITAHSNSKTIVKNETLNKNTSAFGNKPYKVQKRQFFSAIIYILYPNSKETRYSLKNKNQR